MKIAMIGHKRIPSREGGIEIVVEELSERLAEKGHNVTAYNRSGGHVSGKQFDASANKKLNENISVISIPTPKSKKLNAIVYSFFATLHAVCGHYDVIHFHAEGPSFMCFIPKLLGVRTIVTIHGLDWARAKWGGFATKFLKYGEKNAAKYADEIIVLSRAMQGYFMETYGRKTVYIPNGITAPERTGPKIISKAFGLNRNEYILYLGRIVPEKGIHYLIEAYKNLRPAMPLVIAGGASHSEEYFESIKAMAEGENIIFTDFVDGEVLSSLYSNAYIYVLPSELEGMPISLLEAMSYSNCCLTSNIPECTEVCENKAVYFEKGNAESLAAQIARLLENPPLAEKLKSDSADYILSRFNWNEITEKTIRLYKGEELEDING